MLYGIYIILVVSVACAQIVALAADVTLSADAQPIPGGYVVPERGNVTFTCNSGSGEFLLWKINFKVLGNITELETLGGLKMLPYISSSDDTQDNPASFTVHNLPLESNGSFVICSAGFSGESIIVIVMEGSPNCPNIQTKVTSESSLVVSVQQTNTMWLPVCYRVEVTSYNMPIVVAHNSTFSSDGTVNAYVTSLQNGSVYNISVTPCNIVGCNESCDIHSVLLVESESEDVLRTDFDITFSVAAAGATVVVLLIVAMVTTAVVTIVCIRKSKESPGKKGCREGHYEDIVAVDSAYDDVLALSATLHDHAVRHLPTTRQELGHEGYQVMHSAPRSLDVREDGTHEEQLPVPYARSTTEHQSEEHSRPTVETGNDVVMEDNPAYLSLMTAACTLPATMESNHDEGMIGSDVVMEGSPASHDQSLEETAMASATVESDYYI